MDYPDPDEEFELMHADEIEMMNEMDEYEPPHSSLSPKKSKRSLDFEPCTTNTCADTPVAGPSHLSDVPIGSPRLRENKNLYNTPDGCLPLDDAYNKRTVNDLFGDIDDIEFEERLPKRQKFLSLEEKQDFTINSILLQRKELLEQRRNFSSTLSRNVITKNLKNCISRDVPEWPFIAVTGSERFNLYLRLYSKEEYEEQIRSVSLKTNDTGLLQVPYAVLYKEAMEEMTKKSEVIDKEMNKENIREIKKEENELLVEKYRPRTYLELLSDESMNRALLYWLKLWDKVVFNREPKLHKKVKTDFNNKMNEKIEELDDTGRPKHKVALLCGPPGLGKTTLAHTIAKQAGYNIVEVNASDDRSAQAFRTQLEAATLMRSVIGMDPRPNCLVLDEIDGAPQAAIETLIKFINDKGEKKNGKKRGGGMLKRPVICICNDIYVPALRPLRQIAFTLHFPPTSSARLGERLIEICKKECIKSDLGTMMALSEKTHNDIRSCLALLAMMKAKGDRVTLSQVSSAKLGTKDRQQGLFSVWQTIFHIPIKKKAYTVHSKSSDSSEKCGETLKYRYLNVLRVVQSYGDYERLALGVFENFLTVKPHEVSIRPVCIGLDWFCFHDLMSTTIQSTQVYALYPYLPYSFVTWHQLFSGISWPKLVYPSASFEMNQKKTRLLQIVDFAFIGMPPSIQAYQQRERLLLDVIPYLLELIIPNIRPVNIQLHTPKEKSEVERAINVMIDYNLNYTQERTVDGSYVFNLDPNIEEIGKLKEYEKTRHLGYPGRQMIAKEVESEKLRRFTNKNLGKELRSNKIIEVEKCGSEQTLRISDVNSPSSPLPNHLQTLTPKALKKKKIDTQARDFFGRIVEKSLTKEQEKARTDEIVKSDVWFHFKEGYNNAVRKNVYIADLL